MLRRPPRSTLDRSSAASDVYKRQPLLSLVPEESSHDPTLVINSEWQRVSGAGRIEGGIDGAVRILPPTVNGAAQLIATGNLSRSVDRIGEAISPVAWDDDRVGHSLDVGERHGKHCVGGIVADKVASIIHAVDDRIIRAVNIEFREDAAVEKVA